MRQAAVQAPTPPASPRGQAGSAPVIVTQREIDRGQASVPMTAQEVAVLQARRAELSRQLSSAEGHRRDVQKQLTSANGPQDRAGLEQRIGALDARISGLESDMGDVGRQLSSAPAALATSHQSSFTRGQSVRNQLADGFVPISIVFTLFVLAPVALSVARSIWKRGSMPHHPSSSVDTQRLERIEQAMEAIAIEIERVSEGQRFVTRLLAEQRDNVPVGTGQPAKEAGRIQARQSTPV